MNQQLYYSCSLLRHGAPPLYGIFNRNQFSNSVIKEYLCYTDENPDGGEPDIPEGPLHYGTFASFK